MVTCHDAGHMSRCTVTCHDTARSHVTMHGHMSRFTVTCHDAARSHVTMQHGQRNVKKCHYCLIAFSLLLFFLALDNVFTLCKVPSACLCQICCTVRLLQMAIYRVSFTCLVHGEICFPYLPHKKWDVYIVKSVSSYFAENKFYLYDDRLHKHR
jgi:hypothetical protein